MAQLGFWFLHLQRVCLLRQRLLCALELVRVRVKVRARVRVRVLGAEVAGGNASGRDSVE